MKNSEKKIEKVFLTAVLTAVLGGGLFFLPQDGRGEEIFSAGEQTQASAQKTTRVEGPERIKTGIPEVAGLAQEVSDIVLEGAWDAYDATTLTVRRSITVERDGEAYQAAVFTPVLTRRGAVFLDGVQILEMLDIKREMEELVTEVAEVREKARVLEGRYATLIGQARKSMVETYPTEQHRGRVEMMNP